MGKHDNSFYPGTIKYFSDLINIPSGITDKEKIQRAVSAIDTEDKITIFNCIIESGGYFYFAGNLYPGKNHGAGLFISFGGLLVYWRRYSLTDSFYNVSRTEF